MLGPKFGKAVRAAVEQKLRSLQSLHASNPDLPSLLSQAVKTHFSLAGPATAATYQSAFGQGAPRFGTAMLLGGSAAVALTQGTEEESDVPEGELQTIPWVDSIASQPGIQAVSCPGLMLRNHPIGKLIAKQDHLFGTMMGTGQIRDFICFYDGAQRRFHSVVHFGREVCGYPQTVHGGLTAAVIDETLGGLCISLWKSGALGFRPPAYTARLEVDYKQKVPAGGVVLCSTEVESIQDRKVWMRATVTDGKGTVYATSRALFVAPRLVKLGAWGGKPQGRPAPEAPGAA